MPGWEIGPQPDKIIIIMMVIIIIIIVMMMVVQLNEQKPTRPPSTWSSWPLATTYFYWWSLKPSELGPFSHLSMPEGLRGHINPGFWRHQLPRLSQTTPEPGSPEGKCCICPRHTVTGASGFFSVRMQRTAGQFLSEAYYNLHLLLN